MPEFDRPEYVPFDQGEKLPRPPWKTDDPALIAWEKAHGHDARLKCYEEFGCLVIEPAAYWRGWDDAMQQVKNYRQRTDL